MRFIFGSLGTCTTLVLGNIAGASEEDGFVTSNLISVFYHELGHAVIETMQVPIFCQEEDAADVFSILLIDEIFEPESANIIAYDAAFGFHAEAQENAPVFWDVHGPDEQRYYNLVCIFMALIPICRKIWPTNWGFQKSVRSVAKKNMSWLSTAGVVCFRTWRATQASCV